MYSLAAVNREPSEVSSIDWNHTNSRFIRTNDHGGYEHSMVQPSKPPTIHAHAREYLHKICLSGFSQLRQS